MALRPRLRAPRPSRKALTRPRVEALEDRTVPSVFTVTNLLDDGSPGSLRAVLGQTNAAVGADTIVFDPHVYGTITLNGNELEIFDSVTLFGPGAANLTINAAGLSRVLEVHGGTSTLFGLTITGGNIPDGSGQVGAGIHNRFAAKLTLTACTITGNSNHQVGGDGGGIFNYGTLAVNYCTITNNSCNGNGGGIANDYYITSGTAKLTLTNSTLSGNSAGNGGGLNNGGTMTVKNTVFAGNFLIGNLSGGGLNNVHAGTVTGCTFVNNTSPSGGHGGGVGNTSGTLTLTNCTLAGNSVGGNGGGIDNAGTLTLKNSTVSGNSAGTNFGGIGNSGTLTATGCTVAGNFTFRLGGGIGNGDGGTLVLMSSTVSGNTAGGGGGLFNAGVSAKVINCTLAGNAAEYGGGGIDNRGTLLATNSTISGNVSPGAGGVYSRHDDTSHPGKTTLNNTIVARNTLLDLTTQSDLGGNMNVQANSNNNLIGTGGSGGLTSGGSHHNQVGVANPKLGPLQNNGGPTLTMALLAGSPALNKGSNAFAVDALGHPLKADQRGKPRVHNTTVDIGAFEL